MIKKDITPTASTKFRYIESVKMSAVKSDIEIARAAKMKPIQEILNRINVPDKAEVYSPMGRYIAKIKSEYLETLKDKKRWKINFSYSNYPNSCRRRKNNNFCWSL